MATDNVGIEQVELSIDGIPRDTLLEYPYIYNWDTTQETDDEDHVISIIVSDSSNNIGFVPPISVFVDNYITDITPPIGIIANPVSGETVNGIVNFRVEAQDDQGISEVLFYIDGLIVATITSDTYVYEWDTTLLENNTQHTLSASINDTSNNTTILQPVLVTVSNP